MTTPLEKIAEEKNGNYQSSLKGGGGGVPPIGKRPIYSRFFILKASLSHAYKGLGNAICHFLNIVQECQNFALIFRLVPLMQYSCFNC